MERLTLEYQLEYQDTLSMQTIDAFAALEYSTFGAADVSGLSSAYEEAATKMICFSFSECSYCTIWVPHFVLHLSKVSCHIKQLLLSEALLKITRKL